MPGPLPNPNRVRRNAPTIPTTNLPASGRKGRAPACPKWVELLGHGEQWWKWAWTTPQACAWSLGDIPLIARRASMEDDLAAIDAIPSIAALFALADEDALAACLKRLASLAPGRVQLLREMREVDERLGLTPKGMAALRWTIVADETDTDTAPQRAAGVANLDDRRRRLTGTDA